MKRKQNKGSKERRKEGKIKKNNIETKLFNE